MSRTAATKISMCESKKSSSSKKHSSSNFLAGALEDISDNRDFIQSRIAEYLSKRSSTNNPGFFKIIEMKCMSSGLTKLKVNNANALVVQVGKCKTLPELFACLSESYIQNQDIENQKKSINKIIGKVTSSDYAGCLEACLMNVVIAIRAAARGTDNSTRKLIVEDIKKKLSKLSDCDQKSALFDKFCDLVLARNPEGVIHPYM